MVDSLRRTAIAAAMIAIVLGLADLVAPPRTSEATSDHRAVEAEKSVGERMAEMWSGEIDYTPPYSALTPTARETTQDVRAVFDASDDFYGLPRGPGAEDVALYCSACHSLEIVMQQRQSPAGWRYLLDWMSAQQGMAPLPEAERARVLNYLVTEFGEAAAN